jgi:hypothetical protein
MSVIPTRTEATRSRALGELVTDTIGQARSLVNGATTLNELVDGNRAAGSKPKDWWIAQAACTSAQSAV